MHLTEEFTSNYWVFHSDDHSGHHIDHPDHSDNHLHHLEDHPEDSFDRNDFSGDNIDHPDE